VNRIDQRGLGLRSYICSTSTSYWVTCVPGSVPIRRNANTNPKP